MLAGLALVLRLVPGPRLIDDAYITFRYARNLLEGHGFVYNPGERVLGTTTPVYTLLLVSLGGLFGADSLPSGAVGLNAVADAVTCGLLVGLGSRLSGQRRVGLAAALLWAVGPMSVTFAIGGMETSVFIALMVAVFSLHLAPRPINLTSGVDLRRDLWLPFLAAMALLTRPDAALFLLPVALDDMVRRLYVLRQKKIGDGWKGLAVATAAAGVPLAVWIGFSLAYFGNPLPHSIAAKAAAYRLPPEAALVRLIQHYGTPFFEHEVLGRTWPLIGFALYLLLSGVAALRFVRRDSRAWAVVVYPYIYFAVFSAANPLLFRWYLAPPLPVYFLGILGGLDALASDAARAATARGTPGLWTRLAQVVFYLPVVAFGALSVNAWTLRPDHGPARPAPEMAWHQLELIYESVGREMAGVAGPQTTIAAGDVGALGYYSRARILDTVGLMSPEASAYYPLDDSAYVINYAIATDLILQESPDYVVFLEVYGRNTLLADPRFGRAYEPQRTIPSDIYGSRGMLIWRRLP
jgi:hypothetical protein